MNEAEHLLVIHKDRNQSRGRVWEDGVLNRASVVLTVAAWQALVEDCVQFSLSSPLDPARTASGRTPEQQLAAQADYARLKASISPALNNYATPNAEKTRSLFLTVGYAPWPDWRWSASTSTEVRAELNSWLRVRHAIAHGDQVLPGEAVLTLSNQSGEPSLRRGNAQRCVDFFRLLGDATIRGLGDHF